MNKIISAWCVAGVVFSAGVQAKPGKDHSVPGGKPFQALSDAIEANAAAIAVNAEAIDAVAEDVAALDVRVGAVEAELDQVEATLLRNRKEIASLRRMDQVLSSQIRAQAKRHAADTALLKRSITTVRAEVRMLSKTLSVRLAAVNQEIANLAANHDADVSVLTARVTQLLGQVVSINGEITLHTQRIGDLEVEMDAVGAEMASLTAQLSTLDDRVDTLESYHGVFITVQGEAYGHHGACQGWNGCNDPETCALWACEVNGYSNLVSHGEDKPCTEFDNCHLFRSRGNLDRDWGNWCDVRGVTDIKCSD